MIQFDNKSKTYVVTDKPDYIDRNKLMEEISKIGGEQGTVTAYDLLKLIWSAPTVEVIK